MVTNLVTTPDNIGGQRHRANTGPGGVIEDLHRSNRDAAGK